MVGIEVVIPTYRRAGQLASCLEGLVAQTRPASRVLVVARAADRETRALLAANTAGLPIKTIIVDRPGMVDALNEALPELRSELVAFFDDDTVAAPDWLERMARHFAADDRLGAVGGRDNLVFADGRREPPRIRSVGTIDWWGRVNGFHHLGSGPARDVDVLKGCGYAFRQEAIDGLRFDERLRGSGAQVATDFAFVAAVKRAGWRVAYDPAMEVEHRHGVRPADDPRREGFSREAWSNQTFNEVLTTLELLPPLRRTVFVAWMHFVGTRDNVGLVQAARLYRRERLDSLRKLAASQRGRTDAVLAYWSSRHLPRPVGVTPPVGLQSGRGLEP